MDPNAGICCLCRLVRFGCGKSLPDWHRFRCLGVVSRVDRYKCSLPYQTCNSCLRHDCRKSLKSYPRFLRNYCQVRRIETTGFSGDCLENRTIDETSKGGTCCRSAPVCIGDNHEKDPHRDFCAPFMVRAKRRQWQTWRLVTLLVLRISRE